MDKGELPHVLRENLRVELSATDNWLTIKILYRSHLAGIEDTVIAEDSLEISKLHDWDNGDF